MQWLSAEFKVKLLQEVTVGTSYVTSLDLCCLRSVIYSVTFTSPLQKWCMQMSLFSTNEVTVKSKDRFFSVL